MYSVIVNISNILLYNISNIFQQNVNKQLHAVRRRLFSWLQV